MNTILPLFWHLSSTSRKERVNSSVKLISALEQFQSQFIPKNQELSDPEDTEDAPTPDELETLNAQDVVYSIRRLTRGLSSPRENSRLGFAVALTELLSRIESVSCAQIAALILDTSKSQGSTSGQEERDLLFARLFGLTSIIQSKLFLREKSLVARTSLKTKTADVSSFKDVLTQLRNLGERKSWIRESTWWIINLAIDMLLNSGVSWKDEAIDFSIQSLLVEVAQWSPEKVAIALKFQGAYPKRDWQSILSPTFKHQDLLSTGNLAVLARILKESATDEVSDNVPSTLTSNWKPQPHFVWDILLDTLLAEPESRSPTQTTLQEFFKVVIDESLLASASSLERKYWGFQVFQKALQRVPPDILPMLFTQNFMRTWINHLSHPERYLHKAAKQIATDLQSVAQRNPHLGFTLIPQLTGVHGSRQFDKLTKTKTVEGILSSMDIQGIQNYVHYILNQTNDAQDPLSHDLQVMNARRSWVIDQVGALTRNSSIPRSDEWVQQILSWLVLNGLFTFKKKPSKHDQLNQLIVPDPPLSNELHESCRQKLLTCLADLTGQTPSGDSDGQTWVSRVVSTIQRFESESKWLVPITDIHMGTRDLLMKAKETLSSLNKHSTGGTTIEGIELLLSAAIVHQYCTPVEERSGEALQACIEGITRMFPSDRKKSKKPTKPSIASDTVPEPVDVLVDVIIGYMEKSTTYLRAIGNQVFGLLSEQVQESTIDLILAQLERRDPTQTEDDVEWTEDDTELPEEQSDQSSESSDGSSSLDSEDEDDSNNEEEDVETRQRLEETLKIHGIDRLSTDSEADEEVLTDDQMMKIDEQLAEVFRSRASEKNFGRNKNAQREATHFKNRILDLVDMFMRKQPSNPLLCRFILPLIDLIADSSSDEQQLVDKTKGILSSRIGKAKEIPIKPDIGFVSRTIQDLHSRARKSRFGRILPTISQCSLYLTKILVQAGAGESVLKAYRESLVDFITRKGSAINASFIQDFIRRYPSMGWALRDDLLSSSDKAVNVYRQSQAFQIIHVMLTQISRDEKEAEAEVVTFMTSLRKSLFNFTSSACDANVALSSTHLKELFKTGLHAIRLTKAHAPDALESIWASGCWSELQTRLQATERFKNSVNIQKMCGQMAEWSTQKETAANAGLSASNKRKKAEIQESPNRKRKKH